MSTPRNNQSALSLKRLPIGALRFYEPNPRRGDVGAIKESLVANGQYVPLVVNQRTMEVLRGNHTLRAAIELGWEHIDVCFVDADETQAKRIVLADNRTSDLAGYDPSLLVELIEGLQGDLRGSGWDMASVDELLADFDRPALAEDEPPPAPAEPRTHPGDVIELGAHRLVCGDARDPAAYGQLLQGESAHQLWTDPPYGVSYSGKTPQRLTIQNDGADGLKELLEAAFRCADRVLVPGAAIYVAHPAGALSLVFASAFVEHWRLAQTLVWVKDALVLGHADYHYQHEPILYGYKPASGRLGRGAAGWYGDNAQVSVFEVARPKASREHPTMKPPALIEIALRNSSRRGDPVLDPFAGSGSTLVACERTARCARLIELDPAYCDVIIARFERLTGTFARTVG